MKLSIRQNMVPGQTLPEQLKNLAQFGFEGIELTPRDVTDWGKWLDETKRAFANSLIKPSILSGASGCLLDPNKEERDRAVASFKQMLELSAEIGAIGVICVPLLAITMSHGARPRIQDLSPLEGVQSLERNLFIELLKDIGKRAQEVGAYLIVEPLNRYESFWLNRLEEGVDICKAVGNPYVKIMADFFHMHIEESDIPQSILEAGEYIVNVHLADSNRLTPGNGHTDFKAGLAALKHIGYDKYMALECGIPGDVSVELPRCVRYLKGCMA